MAYAKAHKRYPVAIYQDAGPVPHDGRFYVVDADKIVLITAVQAYALLTYEEHVEAHRIAAGHPDPAAILAKERAQKDLRALRAQSVASAGRKARRGGPGGRGGV